MDLRCWVCKRDSVMGCDSVVTTMGHVKENAFRQLK